MCWGESEERYRRQTGQLRLVDGVPGAGWERGLAEKQIVQSLLSPVRPQEAGKSVIAAGCMVHHATTYNVVIAIIEGGGIWHPTIHYPSLALILGPNKVLDFSVDVNCQHTVNQRELSTVLTPPREHGRVPILPPNTCVLLAQTFDSQSIGRDKLVCS